MSTGKTMVAKKPALLLALRKTLRLILGPSLCRLARKKVFSLADGNALLVKFSCKPKRKRFFSNDHYSPETPYGDYIWSFTCGMISDLLAVRQVFIDGFLHWKQHSREQFGRDDNPYQDGPKRMQWDHGYILGHCNHYHPERLPKWIEVVAGALIRDRVGEKNG